LRAWRTQVGTCGVILAIAKRIVELQGGRMWVESSVSGIDLLF
jgi:signal transduction histidine kinase